MAETSISIELRCKRHLHGVLSIPRDPAARTSPAVIEVRCAQCRREAGRTVTHRWRTSDAQRLPDLEDDEVAA